MLMNHDAINAPIDLCMSMWTYVLISLGYIPRNGIAGSYGNCMYLKYYQIIFQSISTVLHSYQYCVKVLITLHPHQHLLFSFWL